MPVQNIIRNDMHAWISNFGLLAFFESKWGKKPHTVLEWQWVIAVGPAL